MARAEDLFERISTDRLGAIDDLIAERASEELFLDFKRSSDNGGGNHLSDRDRDNLARAVSGFGNSEGGVIVWGVDCRPGPHGDVPVERFPIEQPRRFRSWLEGVISGLTLPAHPGVRHLTIENDDGFGYVVTYVPKSYLAPHQCLRPIQYYMRAGSNFAPVPHGVLAGMFGRPPSPLIFHMWTTAPADIGPNGRVSFTVGVIIVNRSAAIARDVYLNLTVHTPNGSEIGAEFPDLRNWEGTQAFGSVTQILSKEGFRLAPGVIAQPLQLRFNLRSPFGSHFLLKVATGCSGSPIKEYSNRLTTADLQQLYADLVADGDSPEARHRFVERILGSPPKTAD